MPEGVVLRRFASFDGRDGRLQEIRQNYDKKYKEMEETYDRQGKEIKRELKENSQELQGMQDMIKDLLEDINDLRQDVQKISREDSCNCSIQFHQNVPDEPKKEPGIDNGEFELTNEHGKQIDKSGGCNKNSHVVDISLGKI